MIIPPYKLYKSKSKLGSMLHDSESQVGIHCSFPHRSKSWSRIVTEYRIYFRPESFAGCKSMSKSGDMGVFRSISSKMSFHTVFCKEEIKTELNPEHRFVGLELC